MGTDAPHLSLNFYDKAFTLIAKVSTSHTFWLKNFDVFIVEGLPLYLRDFLATSLTDYSWAGVALEVLSRLTIVSRS